MDSFTSRLVRLMMLGGVLTAALGASAAGATSPQVSSGGSAGAASGLAPPRASTILWGQDDNAGTDGINSQNYEAGFDQYDDVAADDFRIKNGRGWSIDGVQVNGSYGTGPAASVNVSFYRNASGLPGAAISTYSAIGYSDPGAVGDFIIPLSPPTELGAAKYWVSVQANQDFNTNGQWFWSTRTVQTGYGAAW